MSQKQCGGITRKLRKSLNLDKKQNSFIDNEQRVRVVLYAGCFLIPPFSLLYAIAGLSFDSKRWRKYLLFLIYFFFILICTLELKEGGNKDLIRYYQLMNEAAELSFRQAFDFQHDGQYTANILYWIFGRLGFPQLFPAVTLSVVLLSMAYITCDMAEERGSLQFIRVVLLYQFMILPMMYVMETLRTGLSLSLIVLMAYLDLVKKKKALWIWLIYLACIFIHFYAIVFIVLRIMAELPRALLKMMIVLPLVITTIITVAYGYIDRFNSNPFITSIIYKAYNYYTNSGTEYALGTASNAYFFRLKIVMGVEALLMIIMSFYYSSKESKEREENKKFLMYFAMICILSLSLIGFPNPIYWRFEAAGFCCCSAIMLPVLERRERIPTPIMLVFVALWLLAIPALYLNLRWGITYAENNFEWLGNTFTTNVFTIAYKMITQSA